MLASSEARELSSHLSWLKSLQLIQLNGIELLALLKHLRLQHHLTLWELHELLVGELKAADRADGLTHGTSGSMTWLKVRSSGVRSLAKASHRLLSLLLGLMLLILALRLAVTLLSPVSIEIS